MCVSSLVTWQLADLGAPGESREAEGMQGKDSRQAGGRGTIDLGGGHRSASRASLEARVISCGTNWTCWPEFDRPDCRSKRAAAAPISNEG